MAQLRDIKTRIESVKKTKKITQAMKMVAAAKFKRATEATINARPYLDSLENIIEDFSKRCLPDEYPKLVQENDSNVDVVIILTGDRGLCGGFNANVIKLSEKVLKESTNPTRLFLIGNKGYQYFKSRHDNIVSHYSINPEIITPVGIESILKPLINDFLNGEIGRIKLIHNEFASALSSNLITKQLLPISFPEGEKNSGASDFFYEPSKSSSIDTVLKDYIDFSVYKALLESRAAEEGARMAAMDSATDNAGEMISSLSLVYNRTRQAQITSEISEIVAGSEAASQ